MYSYGLVFVGRPLWREDWSAFFVYAAGPCQRSLSRVRVLWYSRPYFTVSDLRLPFSSPPTTRMVTAEVFEPASTWVTAAPQSLQISAGIIPQFGHDRFLINPSHFIVYTVTCMSDYRRGTGFIIGFIELLHNVTTSNYSANACSHILHFTTARVKSSQSAVAWWRIPTMSSASTLTSLPTGDCLITNSLLQHSCL
jgi:hypothetical protein